MLQDIPANRYQSAAAILADLEQLTVEPQALWHQPQAALPKTTLHGPPTVPQPPMPTATGLTTAFIAQCEQELIHYVGPIGKFLVQNALEQQPHLSPENLVDLLALHIPQTTQAQEFRNHLHQNS
jgi:serine/threonine-protein kinase